jgi:hypothetical protein
MPREISQIAWYLYYKKFFRYFPPLSDGTKQAAPIPAAHCRRANLYEVEFVDFFGLYSGAAVRIPS